MKTHLLSAIAVAIAVSSAAAQWTQMAPLTSPLRKPSTLDRELNCLSIPIYGT